MHHCSQAMKRCEIFEEDRLGLIVYRFDWDIC